MSTDKASAFRSAYELWASSPARLVGESAALQIESQSVVGLQDDLAPLMHALYKTGVPLDGESIKGWHEGMSFLALRSIRTLRLMLKSGRQQVATRELFEATSRLKNAWTAYRGATGR